MTVQKNFFETSDVSQNPHGPGLSWIRQGLRYAAPYKWQSHDHTLFMRFWGVPMISHAFLRLQMHPNALFALVLLALQSSQT